MAANSLDATVVVVVSRSIRRSDEERAEEREAGRVRLAHRSAALSSSHCVAPAVTRSSAAVQQHSSRLPSHRIATSTIQPAGRLRRGASPILCTEGKFRNHHTDQIEYQIKNRLRVGTGLFIMFGPRAKDAVFDGFS